MKPILFSTPMVQAILDGRKTQTRRVVKPQPKYNYLLGVCVASTDKDCEGLFGWAEHEGSPCLEDFARPKYQPGNILYVRETWRAIDYQHINGEWSASIQFKDMAIGERVRWKDGADTVYERIGWRPSIHMPKEAARLFLRVADVRVERLQDISEKDAIAEGVSPEPLAFCDYHDSCLDCDSYPYNNLGAGAGTVTRDGCCITAKTNYIDLWNSINAKRGFDWNANPWVWVYEFEKVKKDGETIER